MKLRSGYVTPEGTLEPDLVRFLLAEVRDAYIRGHLSLEQLEKRTDAALRGDWKNAGRRFQPCRLEERR